MYRRLYHDTVGADGSSFNAVSGSLSCGDLADISEVYEQNGIV